MRASGPLWQVKIYQASFSGPHAAAVATGTTLPAVCPFLPLLKEGELAFSLLSPVLPNLPTQQKSQLHMGLLCKKREVLSQGSSAH